MVTMFMMMLMMMMMMMPTMMITNLLTGPLSFPSLELPPARLRLKQHFYLLILVAEHEIINITDLPVPLPVLIPGLTVERPVPVPEVIDMADRSVEEHCYTMLVSCKADHM